MPGTTILPQRAVGAASPETPANADWRRGGFGVYLHWPFCQAKCPYCDFNSHVSRDVDQQGWRAALLTELAYFHRLTPNRQVGTVFFGGGTPSLMPPETVAALIAEIDRLWGFERGVEITLEANPTSVEAGRFRAYAAAGVNRISMGAQALNDADLRALGRMHSAAEARAAFDIARDAFKRVSFDLIYARQGQTISQWRAELAEALAMAVDHLSLYQLTIEPGTRFYDLAARGKLTIPEDGLAAEMYDATQEMCAAAGMPAYEISNHARPGAESRHNLVYWRYGDYAGVGPGAHGRITDASGARRATATLRDPATWLDAVGRRGNGLDEDTPIERGDQAAEMLMMGLRLDEGISLERFFGLNGAGLNESAVARLLDSGHLTALSQDRIAATPSGRLVLNAVLRELLV